MMFIKQIMSLKVDDVKLNTKQRHLNGDTVQDAVLMQDRNPLKFGLNVFLWS